MNPKELSSLGMWQEWQEKVKASLPNFAANPIYVEQNSVPEHRFEEIAKLVETFPPFDPNGKERDAEFGARVVQTSIGKVTRMWLEGNVEINFLRRLLPELESLRVLDIGAGYGRLAVMLYRLVRAYYCVDAVPISTQVCKDYAQRFAPSVVVLSLEEFCTQLPEIDLVINIHSWNECKLAQVEKWLEAINETKAKYLFTVDHGKHGSAYRAWDSGLPSFKPAIEKYFTLIKEESLGLSDNIHSLWSRK